MRHTGLIAGVVCGLAMCAIPARAPAATNLGLVGIKSVHNAYLQAHTDGELHASNPKRNEEETWFLVEVNRAARTYAIYNWRTGAFMSKKRNGCARADTPALGKTEQWKLVSGKRYGVLNAVAFYSLADGTLLATNRPGNDDKCGGEVAARVTAGPPMDDSTFSGWWFIQGATPPKPGRDFWNTVGNAVAGVANKVNPADVVSLIKLLAG